MDDDGFYVQLIIRIYPIVSLKIEEVSGRREICRCPTDHREVKSKGKSIIILEPLPFRALIIFLYLSVLLSLIFLATSLISLKITMKGFGFSHISPYDIFTI